MAKILINLTDAFRASVREWQKERGLKSWTQALLALAARGLEAETGEPPPEPFNGWGGWRGHKDEIDALVQRADELTDYGRNDPAEYDGEPESDET